jgi:phospholipase/carboxylesterase
MRGIIILVVVVTIVGVASHFFKPGIDVSNMTVSKTTEEIELIEVQTGIDPEYSIIWLHGLGADGHDFEFIVDELDLPDNIAIRFIFPHAPVRAITVNNGLHMRGWYDVYEVPINPDGGDTQDRAGVEQSAEIVYGLVDQENRRGIPDQRIVLAGFSQGGAIALFAGLRHTRPLAGIIALSTYLPDTDSIAVEKHDANLGTPIFMGHGTDDPIIPMEFSRASHDILLELGYNIQWRSYAMPHSVHPDEIRDISQYLRKILEKN